MESAVYTGSFDPITLGHLNVIQRGSLLVDRLIVGIGSNLEKKTMFDPNQRLELVERVVGHLGNVQVQTFDGLAVEFVRRCKSRVMIRGVRPLTDIAVEFTMNIANRELDPGVETVFLMADGDFAHVSSSLIKQIAPMADDEHLARFVPAEIIPDIRAKLALT